MKLFLLVVLIVTFAQAQERYLVSPDNEFIPINKGMSSEKMLKKQRQHFQSFVSSFCDNDGFIPEPPVSGTISASRGQVVAMWFVAMQEGTIDTLFWWTPPYPGDTTVIYVRIFQSNIYPGHGPGFPPYRAPCTPWGYYSGNKPFRDDSADNWISTHSEYVPSFEPFDSLLWGYTGYPVLNIPDNINRVALDELGYKPYVRRGDVFFVTFEVDPLSENSTAFYFEVYDIREPVNRNEYPSKIWKYYNDTTRPSSCSSLLSEDLPSGWYARSLTNDSTQVAALAWGYSVTPFENYPPTVWRVTELKATLSNNERCVTAEIVDCNPEKNRYDNIHHAYISWRQNDMLMPDIPMTFAGNYLWQGCIPGQPTNTTISWSIVAVDSEGLSATFPQGLYRICSLNNEYARVDTSGNCSVLDIASIENEINPNSFFNSPNNLSANPKDDGTAGPFDLGGTFLFYGKPMRYAWVGVNGALAITATANETTDVSSYGWFTETWDFPSSTRISSRDRELTGRMPKNFIAPYWNDLDMSDYGSRFVRMYWETTDCKFIVQWGDSIGYYNYDGLFIDDIKFRVALNRCDGTIEFQYENVGVRGSDTTALVGIQADTISSFTDIMPWYSVNKNGAPFELKPRENFCIRLMTTQPILLHDKWNMVSVCAISPDSQFTTQEVFPQAVSPTFAYQSNGYVVHDTLESCRCYWLKFNGEQTFGVPAMMVDSVVINLIDGWNMVGGPSCSIDVSSISNPLVAGQSWFQFENGYHVTEILLPGKCYWVKSNGVGSVVIQCN